MPIGDVDLPKLSRLSRRRDHPGRADIVTRATGTFVRAIEIRDSERRLRLVEADL
jgi:hypothetical protein